MNSDHNSYVLTVFKEMRDDFLVSTSFIVRELHTFLSFIVFELRQGNKETRVRIGKYIDIRGA